MERHVLDLLLLQVGIVPRLQRRTVHAAAVGRVPAQFRVALAGNRAGQFA